MAGEIDCWIWFEPGTAFPPKSDQPNELLGIRIKPTLQLGSRA
jgi:hypothetical protein